jgi:hypothetical protein
MNVPTEMVKESTDHHCEKSIWLYIDRFWYESEQQIEQESGLEVDRLVREARRLGVVQATIFEIMTL